MPSSHAYGDKNQIERNILLQKKPGRARPPKNAKCSYHKILIRIPFHAGDELESQFGQHVCKLGSCLNRPLFTAIV
ncbi:hypothetical protein AV545_10195 [Paenibacillus jamilae]|nr:hypothetical protein AV545_10195 [Paenibacillus jamilae]